MSEMLKELAKAKEEAKHTARTGEGGNPDGQAEELPEGTSPLEAREETSVDEEETPETAPTPDEPEAPKEEETLIRIGEREFKSQAEAIKYAEELERKTEAAELYNQGVRDALASSARPTEAAPEPEDNFEERFYANPKEELKRVKDEATQDALRLIQAEKKKEDLWNQFLSDNPDIRRKDAERILGENWETIGKMTDLTSAMKALAKKTRAEYDEIIEARKPRTELTNKQTQGLSPSGGAPKRVTPEKKEDRVLSFSEEMRRMRSRQ